MNKMGLCGLVLLGAGCATGLGAGEVRGDAESREAVALEVTETSPERGDLQAVAEDGERFSGGFTQVGNEVREFHEPWVAADSIWYDWETPEVVRYSGQVFARLSGDHGHAMTCQFSLINGSTGLAGGGHGTCDISDGRKVDVVFPHHG